MLIIDICTWGIVADAKDVVVIIHTGYDDGRIDWCCQARVGPKRSKQTEVYTFPSWKGKCDQSSKAHDHEPH